MTSGEKCASRDLTISLEDILSKTSDEVNGHHYHKIDDNSYIKQELKPFCIILQDINDEECTSYTAPKGLCGAENCKPCTELITLNILV